MSVKLSIVTVHANWSVQQDQQKLSVVFDFESIAQKISNTIKAKQTNSSCVLVREPNSENCSDSIFVAPPCENVIFVSHENCIASAIIKLMLDMPSPGSFQNIGL